MAEPSLVAVAGPTCSGKSTLVRLVMQQLGARECVVVSQDEFYRDLSHLPPEARGKSNFDVPGAVDGLALIQAVKRLVRGDCAAAPVYDFTRHVRTGEERPLLPRPYIFVEGTFALHWAAVRSRAVLRVYIHLCREECLRRRLRRDVEERGRTRENVMEQFQTTVWPMHRRYVIPTRRYADMILDGLDPSAATERVVAALQCG